MDDIYDRAKWPPPEANPLVLLLLRGDDWYSNKEVNVALDPARAGKRARTPMANWPRLRELLSDADTIVEVAGLFFRAEEPSRSNQGGIRWFNRRALVIIAMRAQTINAVAFRDWLATKVAGEVGCG